MQGTDPIVVAAKVPLLRRPERHVAVAVELRTSHLSETECGWAMAMAMEVLCGPKRHPFGRFSCGKLASPD